MFVTIFIIASVVIALPHLLRSFYYSGSPLYPLGVGIFKPIVGHSIAYKQALVFKAQGCLSVKDAYGHGRSFLAFIKHFWLIAVPESGVNNAFDYPVGLIYLLVLAAPCWEL